MKNQVNTHRNGRRCVSLLAITLVAVLGAGCDVDGPRVTLPTVPIPATPVVPTGPTVTESRAIFGVNGVSLAAVGHARITLGASESLVITAPERVMALLTSDVVAGTLVLDRESESYQGQASDIRYEIGLVRLDELVLDGVGQLYATGINAAELRVSHSGLGQVRTAGRADRQVLSLNGMGDYEGAGLETRVTRVNMSSGNAVVWASERIEGWIAAGCRLDYFGDATIAVDGPGRVQRLGHTP